MVDTMIFFALRHKRQSILYCFVGVATRGQVFSQSGGSIIVGKLVELIKGDSIVLRKVMGKPGETTIDCTQAFQALQILHRLREIGRVHNQYIDLWEVRRIDRALSEASARRAAARSTRPTTSRSSHPPSWPKHIGISVTKDGRK